MGLFKKKSDPISARARELNDKIADLEAQIKRLASRPAPEPIEPVPHPAPALTTPAPVVAAPQPRLRSTALPHGPTITPQPAPNEVFLEQPDQQRLKEREEASAPEPRPELGTAKSDLGSVWRRFKNNFRGPATSNPKLVSYLAAGSIQGLRPLRYEKRVARNRFILLVAGLALALWGIIWIIARNR